MLIKINKNGKNSRCEKRQLSAMEKKGWKQGVASDNVVEVVEENDTEEVENGVETAALEDDSNEEESFKNDLSQQLQG